MLMSGLKIDDSAATPYRGQVQIVEAGFIINIFELGKNGL